MSHLIELVMPEKRPTGDLSLKVCGKDHKPLAVRLVLVLSDGAILDISSKDFEKIKAGAERAHAEAFPEEP